MAAHVRIRILLAVAVAAICGGVFVVTEVQRRADARSFDEYVAVQKLRSAAMRMSLAVGDGVNRGAAAVNEVRPAQQEIATTTAALAAHASGRSREREGRVREQTAAAAELADIGAAALRLAPPRPGSPPPQPDPRRALMDRRRVALSAFLQPNDVLLRELGGERRATQRAAAQRPVVLVVVLFVIFGLLHLTLVERPARAERRRRRAQREFTRAMQVARSEPEAYAVLSGHVARSVPARSVTVLNRNNSADRLEAVTPAAPGSALADGLAGAAPESCLAVRLAQTQESVDDESLIRCDVCGRSPERTTCVPSIVSGEVVGAVLVEHGKAFGRRNRESVEQAVAEAAPIVANLRNLAIAELRAATDGLTGLPNQRTVHDALKRMTAQASRTLTPLALVLFDLDHFKAINDTYGHAKGDEVLAAVGAVVATTLRASDFVGRFGGEEFAVILPDTSRPGAVEAAEKLRVAIGDIAVPGIERRISASFGVATLPDDAGEPSALFRAADRALYAAKHSGRDRVAVAA